MKRAYNYLFYTLFKFFENAPAKFWNTSKAIIAMIALEVWFCVSLGTYAYIITGYRIIPVNPFHPLTLIFLLILLGIKWYIFYLNDNWKNIVKKFDALPKGELNKSNKVVWTTIIFIIFNLIFSFYLLSQNK